MRAIYKILSLFFFSLLLSSCINTSEPMFEFISGVTQDMHWDENGFMHMKLQTKDSLITTLTDIKYLDRNSELTKHLKEGDTIEIKGIIDCPISFGGFFGEEEDECFIEIREFKWPEK